MKRYLKPLKWFKDNCIADDYGYHLKDKSNDAYLDHNMIKNCGRQLNLTRSFKFLHDGRYYYEEWMLTKKGGIYE